MKSEDIELLSNEKIPESVRLIIADNLLSSTERDATIKANLAQIELDRERIKLDRKKAVWNMPIVAAVAGLLTLSATFVFDKLTGEADTDNTITLEQVRQELKDSETRLAQQLEVDTTQTVAELEARTREREFQYEIVRSQLAKEGQTDSERAAVLLFLVRAGILNTLNRDALIDMAESQINTPDQVIVPSLAVGEDSIRCPLSTLSVIENRLPIPDDLDVETSVGDLLLQTALQELNRGTHEVCSSARIGEYWNSINRDYGELFGGVAWSSAFLSWVIEQSGNVYDLELSAASIDIWRSALEKDSSGEVDITFIPLDVTPERGDIIFFTRSSETIDMETLRTATFGEKIRTHSGIVYSIFGDRIIYISGNLQNMVNQTSVQISDERIIGYIRH